MRTPLELNDLFADGSVARIVDKNELDEVSSGSTAYGLAMVLNKNFDVVVHEVKGKEPRPLRDGEFALIATNEILKICFLSGVYDSDDKVGIKLRRLTEKKKDSYGDKEHTVRLKATLELEIDRHNRKASDTIYNILKKERNKKRFTLTEKALLSAIGSGLKENVQSFLQSAIDKLGSGNLSPSSLKTHAEEDLISSMRDDQGLVFKRIIPNTYSKDERSIWKRLIKHNKYHDPGWVLHARWISAIFGVATVVGAVVSILSFTGVIFAPQPTVTISPHANGSVVIEGNDCVSSSECKLESGSDLTLSISADKGYKLVELACDECPSRLELGTSVTIPNIEGDLIIMPKFGGTRTLLVNNRNVAMGTATCTVVSDDQSGSECAEVPGGTIRVEAVRTTTDGDGGFAHGFDRWQCLSDSWCGGLDLSENPIYITVPESLEPLSITPIFRREHLVTLRIRPSSPSEANVAIATLEGGCLRSDGCTHFREGSTEVYTFQMREGAPPPQPTIAAPALSGSNSIYRFDEWQCDVGQCPSGGPTAPLTLSADVTIKAVYTMQNVLIATGLNWSVTEFPSEDCTTEDTTLRCVFDEKIEVTIYPRSLPNRRPTGWTCLGPFCGEQSYIEKTFISGQFNSSATLTPVYEDNP